MEKITAGKKTMHHNEIIVWAISKRETLNLEYNNKKREARFEKQKYHEGEVRKKRITKTIKIGIVNLFV